MTQQPERIVKKPAFRDGQWCVIIADSHSIFANEIERINCGSREAAYQAYRNCKKEQGKGF